MTVYDYTNDIPNPPNAPSVDVPNMKINTNSISGIISTDHIGFGLSNGGAHNQVQIANTGGINGQIPAGLIGNGFETLYSSNTQGNGELWFVRGSDATGTQLTGPGVPSATSNGYTFLPGGILIQWGIQTGTATSGTVNFVSDGNRNFPNECWIVTIGPKYNSSSGAPTSAVTYTVDQKTISNTQFDWILVGSQTNFKGFYWIAIGN